jgi:hypothetical protein
MEDHFGTLEDYEGYQYMQEAFRRLPNSTSRRATNVSDDWQFHH